MHDGVCDVLTDEKLRTKQQTPHTHPQTVGASLAPNAVCAGDTDPVTLTFAQNTQPLVFLPMHDGVCDVLTDEKLKTKQQTPHTHPQTAGASLAPNAVCAGDTDPVTLTFAYPEEGTRPTQKSFLGVRSKEGSYLRLIDFCITQL